jgi:IclR family transcriptional regulator, acetate operon repressor
MGGSELPARRGGRASSAGNAAEKTLRVLEAAAAPGGPHRLTDIAARAAVPKPTAHRLLVMLAAAGFLSADGGGRYGIGPRLRAFAAQISAEAPPSVEQILRALQATVAGHTVHLALRSDDHVIYTHKIDADRPYQMASRVGMSMPLHCTAIGKCVLAHLPPGELEGFLSVTPLPARTPATITDRGRLAAELAFIRDRGFAVDNEENEPTIRCLAAPVLDHHGHPLGGVSVSTVTFVVSRAELEGFAPNVVSAASRVSAALG